MNRTTCLLLTCLLGALSSSSGKELEDMVAGSVDLTKWESSKSLLTTQRYEGTLTLTTGKADLNHAQTLERRFNCLAPNARPFSDPDQPRPQLPALYEITRLKRGNIGIGHMTFLDPEATRVAHLVKRVATLADFKKLLPKCIPSFIEPASEDDPEFYWYSWASIDERGKLTVHYVEAEQDPESGFGLWIWQGTFQPLAQVQAKPQ